jgi:hypothetical protein
MTNFTLSNMVGFIYFVVDFCTHNNMFSGLHTRQIHDQVL